MSKYVAVRQLPRVAIAAFAVAAALSAGTASAAPLTLDPASPVADNSGSLGSGSASGSNQPGSVLCWLLHPSPTCQL